MRINRNSHTKNALLAAGSGIGTQLLGNLFSFIYRTVFLTVLSKEYLGISGVFTNVLQIFSLTELGLGQAIVFRLYEPFQKGDVRRSAALIKFFRTAYRMVFLAVLVLGAALAPFLRYLVKASEIPADVDLYLIYALFVADNACTYLFSYKRCILNVNQEMYRDNAVTALTNILVSLARIVALLLTKRFEAVVVAGTLVTLAVNAVVCRRITRENEEVFACPDVLNKQDRQVLVRDSLAVFMHKIGGTVVTSTDNLILSAFVSLSAVDIYSNYSLLVGTLSVIVNKCFYTYEATIANCLGSWSREQIGGLFDKLSFANAWISAVFTVCLYALINPFITLWLGSSFVFSLPVVIVICTQFYIAATRNARTAFIDASGLFVKDRVRPLIEAVINLLVSIILVKRIGIAGVFVGTCVSQLLTCYWREFYLLKQAQILQHLGKCLRDWTVWLLLTLGLCWSAAKLWEVLPLSWLTWLGTALLLFLTVNAFFALLFRKRREYRELKELALSYADRIKAKLAGKQKEERL